jgi:hypothetical protein
MHRRSSAIAGGKPWTVGAEVSWAIRDRHMSRLSWSREL